MNILKIIEKKRDKKELTKEEIEFFIKGYTEESIKDYQAAALIMAIYLNGMTDEETTHLTLAMANSGDVLDLSRFGTNVVDKHSTGGVGDKVSIILLPLVASMGITVAKMSGRGLGFTGGTVDKMESIPGYRTNIEIEEFIKNVEKIGISMIGQTMNLAPADKKIYALRDAISCVESIPLIASSIMSKKIASGANKILLDVTVGKGAFMKDIQSAEELANKMISIGKLADKETVCVLTQMDQPLGYSVGNTLEVIEAIEFLKDRKMPEDLKQVVLELGSYMLKLAGKGNDIEGNKKILLENIENGKAYKKFLELVQNQSGNIKYLEDINKFKKAKYIEPVYSNKNGYISEINAKKVGELVCKLGAGRVKKEDEINKEVGIVLNKKISEKVMENEILAFVHADNKDKLEMVKKELSKIIKIDENKIKKENTIIKIIN